MSDGFAHDLRTLLGAIGDRYQYATRMARELRSQVQSLDVERENWMRAFTEPSMSARARLELKEVEALRPRVERSATLWAEKARALELLVGSCVVEASFHPSRRQRAEVTEEPSPVTVLAPPPALWPDVGPPVRDQDRAQVRDVPAQGMSANAASVWGVVCSDPDASPT